MVEKIKTYIALLPDWAPTLAFFFLGILLMISLLSNSGRKSGTQKWIWAVAAGAILLYAFQDRL